MNRLEHSMLGKGLYLTHTTSKHPLMVEVTDENQYDCNTVVVQGPTCEPKVECCDAWQQLLGRQHGKL